LNSFTIIPEFFPPQGSPPLFLVLRFFRSLASPLMSRGASVDCLTFPCFSFWFRYPVDLLPPFVADFSTASPARMKVSPATMDSVFFFPSSPPPKAPPFRQVPFFSCHTFFFFAPVPRLGTAPCRRGSVHVSFFLGRRLFCLANFLFFSFSFFSSSFPHVLRHSFFRGKTSPCQNRGFFFFFFPRSLSFFFSRIFAYCTTVIPLFPALSGFVRRLFQGIFSLLFLLPPRWFFPFDFRSLFCHTFFHAIWGIYLSAPLPDVHSFSFFFPLFFFFPKSDFKTSSFLVQHLLLLTHFLCDETPPFCPLIPLFLPSSPRTPLTKSNGPRFPFLSFPMFFSFPDVRYPWQPLPPSFPDPGEVCMGCPFFFLSSLTRFLWVLFTQIPSLSHTNLLVPPKQLLALFQNQYYLPFIRSLPLPAPFFPPPPESPRSFPTWSRRTQLAVSSKLDIFFSHSICPLIVSLSLDKFKLSVLPEHFYKMWFFNLFFLPG